MHMHIPNIFLIHNFPFYAIKQYSQSQSPNMILLRNLNRSFTQHRLQTLCLNSRIVGSSTTFYRSESSASSSGRPAGSAEEELSTLIAEEKLSNLMRMLLKLHGYLLVAHGIFLGGMAYYLYNLYNNPEARKRVEQEFFDTINQLNRQRLAKATWINEGYESKLVETLKVAGDNANAAKDSKFKTLKATQNYSTLVKEAVDSGIEQNESAEVWKKVRKAKEEMEKIARQDFGDEAKARAAFEALKQVITEVRQRQRKLETPTIQNAIATVKKLSGPLDELNLMIQKERTQTRTRVFSQYKELMEAGRQQWADELSAAFPDINLRAKEGSLTEEEF